MLGMDLTSRVGMTGAQLFWTGVGFLGFTVLAFAGGFGLGNSLGPQGAVLVLVVGLVLSVITSIGALILSIAGTVAFPALRGRFVILLILSVLFSPLLWLGLLLLAL